MLNKRVLIVHGWEATPESDWFPWLKRELEKREFVVSVPAMPDTTHPQREAWVPYLAQTVSTPLKNCYFVGHSLGCITILRYLETLGEGQAVGGAVLVGGFGNDLEYPDYKGEISSFFSTPLDWGKIKKHCPQFVAIHSDDDPWVPIKHSQIFREKLGAKAIVVSGMKHLNAEAGLTELPLVLEELLKILGLTGFESLERQGELKKELWELNGIKNESYIYGSKPELLILSGMHGDEHEVIGCVKEVITEKLKKFPDFLYIPEVSPSAVRRRKRTNEEGVDINRAFFDDSKNVEVRLIFKMLKGCRFRTCIDFHEDPESPDFYLYDAFGPDLEGTKILKKLQEEIKSLGLGLLNGVDDPDDSILGNVFKDGYKYFPPEKPNTNIDGRFETWAFSKGIIKRFLNPEIPGKISLTLKRKAVKIIFEDLVLDAEKT